MGAEVSATGTTGTVSSGPYNGSDNVVTTVKAGENTLADVAQRLQREGVRVTERQLQEANPRLGNPGHLKAGQDIRLPQNNAAAGASKFGSCTTCEQLHTELAKAHGEYLRTGKAPASSHFTPIEIKEGKSMSRAERYNRFRADQGLDPSNLSTAKLDFKRRGDYLTMDDYNAEYQGRLDAAKKEYWQCPNSYEGAECRNEVLRKHTTREYAKQDDAKVQGIHRGYQDTSYPDAVTHSGPLSLAGRVAGAMLDGILGTDKYQELGAFAGGVGDIAVGVKGGAAARARLRAYQGSAGVGTTPAQTGETRRAQTPAAKDQRVLENLSDKEVDTAVEGATSGKPRIRESKRDKNSIPDVEGAKGEREVAGQKLSPAEVAKAQNVFGKRINTNSAVNGAWERAKRMVLDKNPGPHTKEDMIGKGGLYDQTRAQFWKEVYNDPAARKFFEDNGFVFQESGRAPLQKSYTKFPEKLRDEFRVSLDHTKPKATGDNWRGALDGGALEFVTQAGNRDLQRVESLPGLHR